MGKYSTLMDSFLFVPVGFETLGHWGPAALKFLQTVGQRIKESSFEGRASAFLYQRLSIAIQRGNAASVFGTIPHTKTLEEVYQL